MAFSYDAALAFLYSRINYERTPMPYGRKELNLQRMSALIERLGNPLSTTPIIHIAGTKGKGSTAAMCAAMLAASGRSTGLFTSPHLERLEERYSINGELITAAKLAELCDVLKPAVEELDAEAQAANEATLTFFELTTAMAFLYFDQEGVDWAVLEVGLGGRLDSTNVCSSRITAITNISFDHTRQLGNTLEKIAAEKAGIIKSGVPVICGATGVAAEVIQQIARERGAPLKQLGTDFDLEYVPPDHLERSEQKGTVCYRSLDSAGKTIRESTTPLAMVGAHQAANAALALAIRDELLDSGVDLPEPKVHQAFSQLVFPARIEVALRNPTVVIDAAHNVASMKALLQTLAASFVANQRYLIFATTSDKDVKGILEIVAPFFDRIFLTQFVGNKRATPPEELLRLAPQDTGHPEGASKYELCEDPSVAWNAAQKMATEDDLVCISGSFFLAGEIRPLISKFAESHSTSER